MNKVMLIGRLGKDPETRFSGDGLQITTFSVATSEKYKGEQQTEWHNIVSFGKLAEVCGTYLHKGKQVFIEGKIKTNSWSGEDGVRKYRTEILLSQMEMLGSKSDGGQAPKRDYVPADLSDDTDIPF
jgi:single-strand DNA-binding protein